MANDSKTKTDLQNTAEKQTAQDRDARTGKDRGYLSLYGYTPKTTKLDEIADAIARKLGN
jgi:hypothetical protein